MLTRGSSENASTTRKMSKLVTVLEDGVREELKLQQHLKTLKEELRQKLQETQRRQEEELEKRIHQNNLLSTHADVSAKSSTLTVHKQPERPRTSSPALISSTSVKLCSVRTCFASCKMTQESKEEEAAAECRKKFCALPVPDHVGRPVYRKMVELREKERKQGNEERKLFLLSMQKPFSFQEREKEKREKLRVSLEQKNNVTTSRKPKEIKGSPDAKKKEQQAVSRKVQTQTPAAPQETPAGSGGPRLRTAERTRRERLSFLDQKPSFQPQISRQVPEFSRLHKAFQNQALLRTQSKDGMKCRPFHLRTAELPPRKSRSTLENSQVAQVNPLSRSRSLGALTSISADTLPTFITDAARRRCDVIRKSIKMRESEQEESERWLRDYQSRSTAMRKTVALHAKLLDPHSSLSEVFGEKLQRHRAADQQRMREYSRDLRDMRARVRERPYLFEQVKQKSARAQAEQMFRNKLQEIRLKDFVEEARDDTDIPDREENVADGEKIEDVEEKSVKSKGEEMP